MTSDYPEDPAEIFYRYLEQLRALREWLDWARYCHDVDQAAELERRLEMLRGG